MSKGLLRQSLSRELLLGLSLSLAIVSAVTLWLNYRAVENDLERQSQKRAQSIAQSLEFATEGLLEFGNQSILERMVQNFATLPAVHKVSIIDPEGKVIANNKTFGNTANYTTTPEVRQAIAKSAISGAETYLHTVIQQRASIVYIVPFTSRLFQGGGKRGVIVIVLDLAQIQRDAWGIFVISTQTMFLGTIVILVFISLLLRRKILRPIEKLNLAISQSHQTGEIKLPENLPNNEISFLADTLVASVQKLSTYERTKNEELQVINSELQHLSASLEQKVLERTQELTLTNHELEAAKESALAASRAKTAFFANMSHELRTPLNAVLGFTQLVLYAPDTPEVIKEQLDIVNRSGEHLLSLINTVLEMSKIEAGKQSLDQRNFCLSVLLDTVREIITYRAREKNLELIFDLDPHLCECMHGDEMKLKQILINLLNNAVKFTTQGQIVLRVRLDDHYNQDFNQDSIENASKTDGREVTEAIAGKIMRLCFTVADTGIGIKAEDLERIFEGFFQANGDNSGTNSANNGEQEGTGLGLAITRKFIDLMGGAITVQSTLGQGTTFEFFVPIQVMQTAQNPFDASQSKDSSEPQRTYPDLYHQTSVPNSDVPEADDNVSETATNFKPLNILLAEDNLVNQKLMIKMLSRLGYSADIAINGLEVLDALRHKRYDLILMDIQMPLMDGLSATIQINQEWEPAERPVIVAVTANVMEEDCQNYLAAGMKDYIAKPISIALLRNVLQSLHRNHLEPNLGQVEKGHH